MTVLQRKRPGGRQLSVVLALAAMASLVMSALFPATAQAAPVKMANSVSAVKAASGAAVGRLSAAGTTAQAAVLPATGNACLINAPSAVLGTLVGHEGWAFRNGSGDSWTMGATEGNGFSPVVGNRSVTHGWMKTGTWAQVLSTFGQGGPYQKPGYYLSIRCISVGNINQPLATNRANLMLDNGYEVGTNNCLTKAVDILWNYGATSLPRSSLTRPNYYHETVLTSAGFGPAMSLATVTVGVKLYEPGTSRYVNTNPVYPTRGLQVQILDASGNVIQSTRVDAAVQPGTSRYVATIQLDRTRNWSPGGSATLVQIRVRLDYTLSQLVPMYLLKAGTENNLGDLTPKLSDANNDNALNPADYTVIINCMSEVGPPRSCNAQQKAGADINLDGRVLGVDLNLYYRQRSSVGGA